MNVIVYFLGVFLRLFHFLTNPLYDLLAKEKRKIPPIKNDLLKISACDLAEKIRLRQVSPLNAGHFPPNRGEQGTRLTSNRTTLFPQCIF